MCAQAITCFNQRQLNHIKKRAPYLSADYQIEKGTVSTLTNSTLTHRTLSLGTVMRTRHVVSK